MFQVNYFLKQQSLLHTVTPSPWPLHVVFSFLYFFLLSLIIYFNSWKNFEFYLYIFVLSLSLFIQSIFGVITGLNLLGISFLNTIFLLLSGIMITWAHRGILAHKQTVLLMSLFLTIILGLIFTTTQTHDLLFHVDWRRITSTNELYKSFFFFSFFKSSLLPYVNKKRTEFFLIPWYKKFLVSFFIFFFFHIFLTITKGYSFYKFIVRAVLGFIWILCLVFLRHKLSTYDTKIPSSFMFQSRLAENFLKTNWKNYWIYKYNVVLISILIPFYVYTTNLSVFFCCIFLFITLLYLGHIRKQYIKKCFFDWNVLNGIWDLIEPSLPALAENNPPPKKGPRVPGLGDTPPARTGSSTAPIQTIPITTSPIHNPTYTQKRDKTVFGVLSAMYVGAKYYFTAPLEQREAVKTVVNQAAVSATSPHTIAVATFAIGGLAAINTFTQNPQGIGIINQIFIDNGWANKDYDQIKGIENATPPKSPKPPLM